VIAAVLDDEMQIRVGFGDHGCHGGMNAKNVTLKGKARCGQMSRPLPGGQLPDRRLLTPQ
jgi:hypothetical protein